MIKAGRLDRKYNGIIDCFKRTMADEGKIWPLTRPDLHINTASRHRCPVAWQHRQRHPLLPHAGPELCLP